MLEAHWCKMWSSLKICHLLCLVLIQYHTWILNNTKNSPKKVSTEINYEMHTPTFMCIRTSHECTKFLFLTFETECENNTKHSITCMHRYNSVSVSSLFLMLYLKISLNFFVIGYINPIGWHPIISVYIHVTLSLCCSACFKPCFDIWSLNRLPRDCVVLRCKVVWDFQLQGTKNVFTWSSWREFGGSD